MPGSERSVVRQLQDNKEELVKRITALHFERHPKLEERYGEEGKKKCYDDAIYHLNYLEQAARVDSKTLFNDYLDWARVMLQERDIPANDLVDNIVFLRRAVQEILDDQEAETLVEYINEGLTSLKEAPSNEITFLNAGDPLFDEARTYLDLLLSGKRKKASELIEKLVEEGVEIKDIYEHIFQKTQYEVGALWQTNKITVAHEHYCTAATQLIMSQLYPKIFSMDKSGNKLVACSVADELHEIGIRMVADFFEMDGWDTHYLGSNMPNRHLIDTVLETKAEILAISVTLPLHISKAKELIDDFRSNEETESLKIMVGGYPFSIVPDLWKKIGADASAGSAKEAIKIANKLIIN